MDSFGLASILLVSLVFSASFSNGAVSQGYGCPEGIEIGQTWYNDGCEQCWCEDSAIDSKYHTCHSCGSVWGDPKRCYMVRNDTATYPDCCDTFLCRGDDGFDEEELVPIP